MEIDIIRVISTAIGTFIGLSLWELFERRRSK